MSDQKVNLGAVDLTPPAQPGEAGYTPPTEAVPLPSKGKVYPPESPLAGADVVEIRSMTARDEDILTSRALLKSGKAIDTLLKSCIVNKSINPGDMLVGDRNAALVAIRITGYGRGYKVKVECPKCGEKVENEFDLGSLPLKEIGAEPVAPGTNEFAFVLPVSKKTAIVKLLTGSEEQEISMILEKNRKANAGGVDSAITTHLLYSTVSIGGEKDRNKLSQIVRNLPARDSKALRAFIQKISPGVEMTQNLLCPRCNEESEVDVPMGTEFFWPEA